MMALQDMRVPRARLEDTERDLVKMGSNATCTAARGSIRAEKGCRGGAAVISKGHLRVTSFRHLAQAGQVTNVTSGSRRNADRASGFDMCDGTTLTVVSPYLDCNKSLVERIENTGMCGLNCLSQPLTHIGRSASVSHVGAWACLVHALPQHCG